jgi:NADPH-dependent glutamate synthase beta subunit-like oxidoreductase
LVRYGVAPDHVAIRDVRATMQDLLDNPRVRFVGNVEVGRDISLSELRTNVDAVVYSHGAALDRELGIPGEGLPGSLSARDIVSWYCGHPDAHRALVESALERARVVVVVGVGNVALDVARVLAKGGEALEWTDMPEHVLDVLRRSPVRDVHIVGRRGPARAAFTSKELRELGGLEGVDVFVAPGALELDEVEAAVAAGNKVVSRNLAVMREWSQRQPAGHAKRVRFHFWARPAEVTGTAAVDGVVLEEMESDGRGGAQPSGRLSRIEAQLVVRAVGYRSTPLGDVPSDQGSGVVTHAGGRLLRNGAFSAGEYVAGWAKRGPSGVIGTNKLDAIETVEALLEDAPSLLSSRPGRRRRPGAPPWPRSDGSRRVGSHRCGRGGIGRGTRADTHDDLHARAPAEGRAGPVVGRWGRQSAALSRGRRVSTAARVAATGLVLRLRDSDTAAVCTAAAARRRSSRPLHPETDRAPRIPSGPKTGLAEQTIPLPDSSRSKPVPHDRIFSSSPESTRRDVMVRALNRSSGRLKAASTTKAGECARITLPTPVACAGSRPPMREGSAGPLALRRIST